MSKLYQDGRKWGGILVRDEINLHGKAHALYAIRHYISGVIGKCSPSEGQNGLVDGILDAWEGM